MNRFFIYACLAACICPAPGRSQNYRPPVFADSDRDARIRHTFPVIDSICRKYAGDNHFPGLVYGIVADGKLVHAGAVGYSDAGRHTAANVHTIFRIASMSKSFTAMAVLKLRDEGRLKLDDPVDRYIPEAKKARLLTRDAPRLTIRMLLMHAGGLPEDNPWGDRQLAVSDRQLLALYRLGPSFSNDPAVGYEYSNLGFATLGYIIKKISGEPYETYITRHILRPLGMRHTVYEYTAVPRQLLAHGYRWLDGKWVEQPILHDGAYGAMGGMLTSVEDFSRYLLLQLSAWPPRDDAERGPVERSSLREMQFPWDFIGLNTGYRTATGRSNPYTSAYGYGLVWRKYADGIVSVGHPGGLPGFGSDWIMFPDLGIGVYSMANLTYARAGALNLKLADTLIRLSRIRPRKLPPSAVLTRRRDELIRLLPSWDNARASGIFAENFFLDYFTDRLRDEATAIFSKAGRIGQVGEVVPENQLRGYFVLKGERADIRISFTLSPEKPARIQAYAITLVPGETVSVP